MAGMELAIAAVIAIVLLGIFAVTFGTDSRPRDESAWWPGSRSDAEYPQHHA